MKRLLKPTRDALLIGAWLAALSMMPELYQCVGLLAAGLGAALI